MMMQMCNRSSYLSLGWGPGLKFLLMTSHDSGSTVGWPGCHSLLLGELVLGLVSLRCYFSYYLGVYGYGCMFCMVAFPVAIIMFSHE